MPGIVVFRRRWSVGSDDLVVPGAFLFTVHLIWTVILAVLLGLSTFDGLEECEHQLLGLVMGYMVVLFISMGLEIAIAVVAMRGSILDTAPRASMQYILYVRVAVMLAEAGWLSLCIAWFCRNYFTCPIKNTSLNPRETVVAMLVCNWCILLSVLVTVWCTYDTAGRSWVKMKQYQQRSMRIQSESKYQYRRSGSTRNWRQRKVLRAYQDSWQSRCRFLFCCAAPSSDRNRNSFADIARLLSDFFRDLDVVPSDVIAGLVLLRKFQKIERRAIVEQRQNDTYEFLSGVAVTPRTQFLALQDGAADAELFQTVIRYANFAVRAYGWPVYVMTSSMGVCKLCSGLSCCCFPRGCRCGSCCGSGGNRGKSEFAAEVVEDNCCRCNYAALQKIEQVGDIEVIYATYHVDVGQTPFFVALDYDRKKVVISIRGTLSMKDVLTDLNGEGETLPLNPPRDDWLGHKGMVQAAQYILEKLQEEQLIERALNHNPDRSTNDFQLVIVGHSLGAGTATILGILLRQYYASLQCYCYAPPGGLLSMPAVEYTKSFTISVVVGKDVVPRIGLHQMEALRADLINAIKRSVDPKWKTISCSIVCCGCSQPTSAVKMSTGESDVCEYMRAKQNARCIGIHPSDSSIALTSHQPLYPPGRIIHVVRHHPTQGEQALSKRHPFYQALWAQNTDFDEVLISPVMVQDHMPDKLLDVLNKVVTTLGPRKPQRISSSSSNNNNKGWTDDNVTSPNHSPPTRRLYLETSFTSLQTPTSANSFYSTRSHQSSPLVPYPEPLVQKSLSLTLPHHNRRHSHVDLIHDDWFGLAPLASPESLSEVSSISSRTSVIHTPKIMRRTPKIIGSLSHCADDYRNVRNFKMAKVFSRREDRSPNGSYESASDIPTCCVNVHDSGNSSRWLQRSSEDEFQSAEDILDNVLTSAGCKEFFSSSASPSLLLETHFEVFEPVTPSTPQEIDQDLISNLAIDLNLDEEHRSTLLSSSKPPSLDSASIHCRTPASEPGCSSSSKIVTFNPQVINIDPATAPPDAARWTFFGRTRKERRSLSAEPYSPPCMQPPPPPKTILMCKRRNSEDDPHRVEALPLLSNLSGGDSGVRTTCSPPGFVRRKKYVYPVDRGVNIHSVHSSRGGGESNV